MKILPNILKLRHEAEINISTLPALLMMADKISGTILHGMHSQRKSGAGEKFWQFREYTQSDHLQDIDWRQSAKNDHIFIKQKEWQTTQKTYLWCASGSSMNYSSAKNIYSKQACAQIISLSLALLLRRSEEQVGLFGDLKTGKSDDKMQKIGQILLDNSNIEQSLPNSLDFALPQHSSFIAIGDFLAPINDISDAFSSISMAAQNALIIQIIDPAELDLTYRGRVKFKDINSNESTVINHVASVRSQYKKRMEAHINQVRLLCYERGWSYVLHKTDTDIAQTLKDIWLMMDDKEGKS